MKNPRRVFGLSDRKLTPEQFDQAPHGLYEVEGSRRHGEIYDGPTDRWMIGPICQLARIDDGDMADLEGSVGITWRQRSHDGARVIVGDSWIEGEQYEYRSRPNAMPQGGATQ